MFIKDSSGVRLTHVVARGTANDDTLCRGISVSGSRVSISDSRMLGAGGSCTIGIGLSANTDSTVQISDRVLRGNGSINGIGVSGTSSNAGEETTIRIRCPTLSGAVLEGTPGETGVTSMLISHSQVDGAITGTPEFFNSHDPGLNALNAACLA